MKLKEAVDRLRFTIGNSNKPNKNDVEAFNLLLLHFQKTSEQTIQENLLFAKLYTFVLQELTMHYKDVDFANVQLNKLLSEPIEIRIEKLLSILQMVEITKAFHEKGTKDNNPLDPTQAQRYPELISAHELWDKDNVIAHLNSNINLSIQNFKNNV